MKTYRRKVIQVGNSEGISIPPRLLGYLNVERGDFINISVDCENDGGHVIRVVPARNLSTTK